MSVAVLIRLLEPGEPLRAYFEEEIGRIYKETSVYDCRVPTIMGHFMAAQYREEVMTGPVTQSSVQHLARKILESDLGVCEPELTTLVDLTWAVTRRIIQAHRTQRR